MSEYVSVPAVTRPAAGPLTTSQRFWRGYGYLLGGLPLCIVAFVIAIAGFSVGVGTIVVWIGLPILAGTLRASRGLAGVERRATSWATGRALPPHHYREARGRGIGRLFSMLADPQSWRDLLHAVVALPGAARDVHHRRGLDGRRPRLAAVRHLGVGAAAGRGRPRAVLADLRIRLAPGRDRDQHVARADHGGNGAAGRAGSCRHTGRARTGPAHQPDRGPARPGRPAGVQQARRRPGRGADSAPARARHPRRPAAAPRPAEHGPGGRGPQARRQPREGPPAARGGPGTEPGGPRRAACPVPRHRPADPRRPRPRARARRRRRTLPGEVSLDVALPKGQRLAAAVENTAYFVVTEALTNVAKHAQASALHGDGQRGRRPCAGAGARRRPRAAPTSARATGWPASPTDWPPSRASWTW